MCLAFWLALVLHSRLLMDFLTADNYLLVLGRMINCIKWVFITNIIWLRLRLLICIQYQVECKCINTMNWKQGLVWWCNKQDCNKDRVRQEYNNNNNNNNNNSKWCDNNNIDDARLVKNT